MKKELLHPQSEVYAEAFRAVQSTPVPTSMFEHRRINVKYMMEDKEVIYTVTFQPMFDGDTNEFQRWVYYDIEMYISSI